MKSVSLGDVAELTFGFPFPSATYKNADSGMRLLRGDNVGTGSIRWDGVMYWPEGADFDDRYLIRGRDIVLAMDRPVLSSGLKYGIASEDDRSLLVQRVCRIRGSSAVDSRYLGAVIGSRTFRKYIDSVTTGSAVPHVSGTDISRYTWDLPPIEDQIAIGEVLSALDAKIAANRKVIFANAELSITLVERAIQRDSEGKSLEQVAVFMNQMRVPLSKAQREARDGVVPYYGATGQMDSVDEALFDENLVLVGEDGSVIENDGTPIVQYIWGPSWVNNHAHVLRGDSVSTELLRWLIDRSSVTSLITGAVQPKLNMGNLKSLILEVPRRDVLVNLEQGIASFSAMERALIDENSVLAHTRDELLPLLMGGRITVKDAERAVEDAL